MRKPLLAQFKVVHQHTERLLEAMQYDISRVEADFLKELESISTVLGVLIERVEDTDTEDLYNIEYIDAYTIRLTRIEASETVDADARGETSLKFCDYSDYKGGMCPKCHNTYIAGEEPK